MGIRTLLCGVALAGAWLGGGAAALAQSSLDELERRLDETPPPAVSPAPRATTPAPAPRAAGGPASLGLQADNDDRGVIVLAVEPGGPADAAGIRAGDLLTSVDRRLVRNLDDLAFVMGRLTAGQTVQVDILRDGRVSELPVRLGSLPAEAAPPASEGVGGFPAEEPAPAGDVPPLGEPRGWLGVQTYPVTADLQRRLGFTSRQGAVIDVVRPGSPADRYGLPIGGVITAADGIPITGPDDLTSVVLASGVGATLELTYEYRGRVLRKQVTLAAAPAAPAPRAPAPAPRASAEGGASPLGGLLPPGLAERPLVRRLEGALDRVLTPPADGSGGALPLLPGAPGAAFPGVSPPTDAPPGDAAAELSSLRAEVAALSRIVEQLEARLAEMESRLPAAP